MSRHPSLKQAFYAFSKSEKYKKWNRSYDAINWEEKLANNPFLAGALGGLKVLQNIAPSLGSNCSYSNCQLSRWFLLQPVMGRRKQVKLRTKKLEPRRAQRSWESSWQSCRADLYIVFQKLK
jgi:hypothetical protein